MCVYRGEKRGRRGECSPNAFCLVLNRWLSLSLVRGWPIALIVSRCERARARVRARESVNMLIRVCGNERVRESKSESDSKSDNKSKSTSQGREREPGAEHSASKSVSEFALRLRLWSAREIV